jgi:hypothetical protein
MSTRSEFSVRQQVVDSDGTGNASEQPDAPESASGVQSERDTSITIGWREWISLPELGLPAIKAKVDTGARTSALHALNIERFSHNSGEDWVAFTVQPIQRDSVVERRCKARLLDIRKVTDSGGHSKERYFINTQLCLGDITRQVEITLSERSDMLFRMLLGRTSIVPDIVVNPQLSYTVGRLNPRPMYVDDNSVDLATDKRIS